MVCDHVGCFLFPSVYVLRIIGRLAFPIFAFLICDGCRYTRNKPKYFLRVFVLGVAMLAVTYFVEGEIYGNIFVTFSFSIALIFALQEAFGENASAVRRVVFASIFLSLIVVDFFVNKLITIDYGFSGTLAPVVALGCVLLYKRLGLRFLNERSVALIGFAVGLAAVRTAGGVIQYFCLFALVPFALYNGKKGFKLPKYFFYAFYPAHIALLWLISQFI